MPKVQYNESGMTIHLPTKCPAHLHSRLLRGISAMLKHQMVYPMENNADTELLASVSDLQTALLPTEEQLEKVFKPNVE